jgi:hypothetical protein
MSDWTTDAADAIERGVQYVREKTVEPVHSLTKAVVYGTLAALILVPAAVLFMIMLFRLCVFLCGGYVWAAWCLMGGIFMVSGWFLWALAKRNA